MSRCHIGHSAVHMQHFDLLVFIRGVCSVIIIIGLNVIFLIIIIGDMTLELTMTLSF